MPTKKQMKCVYDGGYRATVGGNASGMPIQSSLDERQCACTASSASWSGGGTFPTTCECMFLCKGKTAAIPLPPTKTCFLRKTSCVPEGWLPTRNESPSLQGARESGAGDEA
jgi:hypothetical protein